MGKEKKRKEEEGGRKRKRRKRKRRKRKRRRWRKRRKRRRRKKRKERRKSMYIVQSVEGKELRFASALLECNSSSFFPFLRRSRIREAQDFARSMKFEA